MACVASQQAPRSISVRHSAGHTWRYDFPLERDEPILHGQPVWAHSMVPADPDVLTAEAKAAAVEEAKSLGLLPEFSTEGIAADGIRVRDLSSGHEFVFKVATTPDGERILEQQATVHANQATQADHHLIHGRARNYAETEMLNDEKIDRL